jgi:hypothetical protein
MHTDLKSVLKCTYTSPNEPFDDHKRGCWSVSFRLTTAPGDGWIYGLKKLIRPGMRVWLGTDKVLWQVTGVKDLPAECLAFRERVRATLSVAVPENPEKEAYSFGVPDQAMSSRIAKALKVDVEHELE